MSHSKTNYGLLAKQLSSLIDGERNLITNLSQFSALVFNQLEKVNWAGFYIRTAGELLKLGPFQGQVACTTIKVGHGVCGTAAATRESVLVENVDLFQGHIACDARSRSELVCPVIINNQLWGVFDLDSPELARFNQQDRLGIEELIKILVSSSDWHVSLCG